MRMGRSSGRKLRFGPDVSIDVRTCAGDRCTVETVLEYETYPSRRQVSRYSRA
ncbi:hypothetical protein AArcMg_1351 [Natrarchaeobaculum sulfurireducens]|uniref:Uncharacterized protein n=1 Tax=Natrarchaeobaculum sulfurireducens TaxID=2044521 RepID=A0A346PPC1_9EURY|nr:hypothetical protein AArc1_2267 [Natrarchaeobaculum sulfurireducens]AXR81366.1 hypothetical protein AArcMg_1351 [Natrarchaeobaculum sulfurireducens]